MVEGFDVEEWVREAGPGGFGVVEGDDEDRGSVGEGAIPGVVVGGRSEGEAAAVDGEDAGEEGGGEEVVVGGEEDAAVVLAEAWKKRGGGRTGLGDVGEAGRL